MDQKQIDAALIAGLGGVSRVAALLGLEKRGGVQRVQNWMERGIPAAVKVSRPDLFMPGLVQAAAPTTQEQGVA